MFSGAAAARPLGNMVMLILLGRMGRCDLTAHDFRSTFSDWCAERTNTPSEVREMALAHAVGKVEAAYRRGDLFREAAPTRRGIGRLLHGEPRGAVIPLRAAQ